MCIDFPIEGENLPRKHRKRALIFRRTQFPVIHPRPRKNRSGGKIQMFTLHIHGAKYTHNVIPAIKFLLLSPLFFVSDHDDEFLSLCSSLDYSTSITKERERF